MKSIAVKVSAAGRLNLPSEVRKVLGLRGSGHVILALEDGRVTIKTMAQTLDELRALARPYAPKDHLASEELLAERREEAEREGLGAPLPHRRPERRSSP